MAPFEKEYPLIGELREFLKENGWVIRYESCRAAERGKYGEEVTDFAAAMIAGWMLCKAQQMGKENNDDDRGDGEGATREAGA